MTTTTLNLLEQSGKGRLFDTGDDKILVLRLEGTWYEMGQQYGTLAKDKIEPMWDGTVEPARDRMMMPEDQVVQLFGKRVFNTSSLRRQSFYRGVADGMGWPVEKVVLLDQSGMMGIYQGKLHSFSGCTSLFARGEATADGHTYVGRNLDWSESFLNYSVFLTVYNPTDGSNGVANVGYPAWYWPMTAINNKGVYVDLHDGTSMGGAVISADVPTILNQIFDFLAECSSAEAASTRVLGARPNVSMIWSFGDPGGGCYSVETTLYNSLRREPQGDTLTVVNTFLDPGWNLHARDTVSNSFTRYKNIAARAAEAHSQIDSAKMRAIFDLPIFNPDGSFAENGGATKPKKQDADITTYQTVMDLDNQEVWIKIPVPSYETDWRHFDLKALFGQG